MNDRALFQLDLFIKALDRVHTVDDLYLVLNMHYPPCLAKDFLGESIEVFEDFSQNTLSLSVRFPNGTRLFVHWRTTPEEMEETAVSVEEYPKSRCVRNMCAQLADYVTDLMTP